MHGGRMIKERTRNTTEAPVKPAGPVVRPSPPERKPQLEPPYHVILHDDDKHSHTYVVEMLATIFGYDHAKGFQLACMVNDSGCAIVATCHKELAELRLDQIQTFVHDPRLKDEGQEPMKATMEPAE
jgi:ATP-dependent Clp protease adaptor protein ClpS